MNTDLSETLPHRYSLLLGRRDGQLSTLSYEATHRTGRAPTMVVMGLSEEQRHGFIHAQLLNWRGSLIITDPHGAYHAQTAEIRRHYGRVSALDADQCDSWAYNVPGLSRAATVYLTGGKKDHFHRALDDLADAMSANRRAPRLLLWDIRHDHQRVENAGRLQRLTEAGIWTVLIAQSVRELPSARDAFNVQEALDLFPHWLMSYSDPSHAATYPYVTSHRLFNRLMASSKGAMAMRLGFSQRYDALLSSVVTPSEAEQFTRPLKPRRKAP